MTSLCLCLFFRSSVSVFNCIDFVDLYVSSLVQLDDIEYLCPTRPKVEMRMDCIFVVKIVLYLTYRG